MTTPMYGKSKEYGSRTAPVLYYDKKNFTPFMQQKSTQAANLLFSIVACLFIPHSS